MEEVHFTITREDFWHYQTYIVLHYRRRRSIVLVLLLIVGSLLISSGFASSFLWLGISLFLLFVVCLIASIAFRSWRNVSKAIQVLKKTGVESITISEQGMQRKNDLGETTMSWKGFKAIQDDKHNLYFILEVAGASATIMALVIPRRAFASQEAAANFLERVRRYWRNQSEQSATCIQ